MTDVGKISLEVEINGDDLAARLGEAVRTAVAPALDKLNRKLQETQRAYNKTGDSAEKSAVRQVAALKRVEEQADATRRAVERAAAASRLGGGGRGDSTAGVGGNDNRRVDNRRIDNRRYDYRTYNDNRKIDQRRYDNRKVDNRKYDYSTKNDQSITYDYRSYHYDGVPGPTPGGGGGGGGFGRGGGRGGGGRGGVLGFLTGPVGLNTIAQGAAALPAVATGVVNIVGAVQQLTQAGLALPGIFAGGAAAIGTAVIGFQGLGDAIKALNEADADPAKLEEANKALEKLAPSAAAVAREVSRLTVGPLRDFQKAIAQPLFEGLDKDIGTFADKALPRIQPGMQKVAKAINSTFKEGLAALGDDKNLSLADQIFGNTAEGQQRANNAIRPLISAFGTLAKEGSVFLPRLGDAITSVADRFNRFIQTNTNNGNIFRWIDEGLNGARAFGNTILNILKTITGLTKAAGQAKGSLSGDGGLLGALERVTERWSTFTNSVEGQQKLGKFFADGTADLRRYGDLLRTLWPTIKEIIAGFQTWGEIVLPIVSALASLTNTLAQIPGLLEAVVVGFLAWRTLGPIIGGVANKLNAVGGAAGKLGGARGLLGGSLIAGGGAIQASTDSGLGQLAGALTQVAGGALAGSVFGPAGAAVGAGVGAAIAGITYVLNENARASRDAAAAQAELAENLNRSRVAMELTSQATKTANDALLASGGAVDAATIGAVGDQISAIPDRLAGSYDEDTIKGVATALKDLSLTEQQLATIVTGAQPGFDALTARLREMGPGGAIAAQNLQAVRDATLGAANNAATAAPLLQNLAQTLGVDVPQAAAELTNAFSAVPKEVPINIDAPGGQAVFDMLVAIGEKVSVDNNKNIVVEAPLAPAVLEQLKAIGYEVTQNNDKTITVRVDPQMYADTLAKLGNVGNVLRDLHGQSLGLPAVPAGPNNTAGGLFPGMPGPTGPGGADGMVIPGYAPKQDTVNAVLAPGEGVLIPEAVRGLGGAQAIYAINSRFRKGLSRRYYADGGVHGGTGALPGPAGIETELSVLVQIRDILAGKGGPASNPLAATAANTGAVATATKATSGQKLGPFGTPIKDRDPAYEAAAAAISALGGDPEKFLGQNPVDYAAAQAAQATQFGGGLGVTGAVNMSAYIEALTAFAMTGDLSKVQGIGLNANSPVITALTSARNKAKGGLSDQQIADLVGTTLGPTGYTGTLDSTNSSLVKSLTRYREQLMKQGGAAPAVGGASAVAPALGIPMTALPAGAMDPISAYAAAHSGGKYSWGASDLAAGLSDCSGAVSDLVELLTKGQATGERLFSTADAGSVLKSLGAVEGALPGALQIGWDAGHMRATLPNGVAFESGGGTGQGATYGGNAKGAAGMPNIMSLPVGALPAGLGMSGLPGGGVGGQGTPVYVTNWPGQGGGIPGLKNIFGAGIGAAGQAGTDVLGDIMGGVASLGNEPWNKPGSYAALNTLVKEGNPLALAKAFGLDVADFSRAGGAAGELEKNEGRGYDASGRLFSDTGALLDRTFTSLNAQLQAMREQMVDVIEQVSQKLNDSALEPVVKAGVQSALETLKDSVSASIGTALGQAAAPPIADAVGSAVSSLPIDQSGAGNVGGNAAGVVTGALGMASGGPVSGGTPGKDSVPALLMPGEYVLNTSDVARLGGMAAIDSMRSRGFKRFATGGGVIGNDTVGADFFGVSQVPIIGAIVNLLVRVLLKVIGVDIEVRDTLMEMTDDFRQFRGDAFKAFDAQGRLLNDTSGLIERSQSSEETAAEERIRILKIVIQALIKYIIEKVIVPIAKAVANAAIQAGASAAGAAVNSQAPGAGGIVSSLISSAGQAGVDIAAEVGTDFALAISETLIDVVGEGLKSLLPDLTTGLFGGNGLAFLTDPVGSLLGGLLGGIAGLFSSLFGGAATMIPGIPFDNGGLAHGEGLMLKATNDPELVLNPTETDLFTRFVKALENGGFGGGSNTTVHAPITVIGGGPETAEQIENRLLKHMP
ncbi:tape measure protein [Mycobacterium phage Mecca]|nr:tape measure protein [Mycobacterium phage Mecca]